MNIPAKALPGSEDVDSEISEEVGTPGHESNQQYDCPSEDGAAEDTDQQGMAETADDTNPNETDSPLDMRNIPKHENGHASWPGEEPINMTKVEFFRGHQDHSYDRAMSPCVGCVKREASATPDDMSGGTKDEDDDEEEDDSDKIDINKYDPERLKAFNMFVRLFVDENLDRMVPISRQPKDKIQAIIDSCARQFPEFSERSRKRIRTYLKSCRRNKRTRDHNGWDMVRLFGAGRAPHPHLTSALAEQILATACENESQNAKRMRLGLKPIAAEVERGRASSQLIHLAADGRVTPHHSQHDILQNTLRHGRNAVSLNPSQLSTASVAPIYTSSSTVMVNGSIHSQSSPTPYLGSSTSFRHVPNSSNQNLASVVSTPSNNLQQMAAHSTGSLTNGPTDLSMKKSPNNTKYSLNPNEVSAVKQLIAGYRESAAFLLRSADELEQLLLQQN